MHSNGCGIFDAPENMAWYCLIHSGLAEIRGGGGEFLFILSFFCCHSFFFLLLLETTALLCSAAKILEHLKLPEMLLQKS